MDTKNKTAGSIAAAPKRLPKEPQSSSPSSEQPVTKSATDVTPKEKKSTPPIHREDGIAIWRREKTNPDQADYYVKLERSFGSPFFKGASREQPHSFDVFASQKNGPTLSPEQVAMLVRGEGITGTFVSEKTKKEYSAVMAVAGVDKSPWKKDATRENRTLRINRAFPMFKTTDDEDRVQWGWEANRVVFPLVATHGDRNLAFGAAQVFQCLNAGECKIDGHAVKYLGAEQKKPDHNPVAKFQIFSPKHALAEVPRVHSEEVGQGVSQ